MTNSRMIDLIVKRTGYPEAMVRHVLDIQKDVIRACLIRQESVHFPELLRLFSEIRSVRVPGQDKEEKVVLRVRPMTSFRKELNKWTSTE